ncbi:DUF6076 domain-containing protein [Congzhengia sp.]|uniref:DUF6076 domain-containing protein n=1 Tax=Congzhengia sp. TaxID=2944168 RepID=UPI003077D424
MDFEVVFNQSEEKIITEKGSYVVPIGSIACALAEGNRTHLKTILPDLDTEKAKIEATKMLERCFSSKDKGKRVEGYLLCDEEFKLSKTKYSVTKTIENVDAGGEINFVDMYYLSDFLDFLRLEMMYALTNNMPIVKCGSCSKFFLADNPTMEYCNNEACRHYGAKKRSKETKQADSLLLLYDKVYQAIYYKQKKCTAKREKIYLKRRLQQLMDYRMKYKKGEITADEFTSVLEE